jgi:trans-aconitate methyltransferase
LWYLPGFKITIHYRGVRLLPTDSKLEPVKPWIFDRNVADNFDEIATKNIPDYEHVISQCIKILSKLDTKNPRIIDVGCATGNTLSRLYNAGFTHLVGVDSSQAMLDAINLPDVELVLSESFPVYKGPYDVVLANWTLHFIEDRKAYLTKIAEGLSANGVLLLTEKTQSSTITQALYRDFKRANGLTEEEIQLKEQQLNGILTPYCVNWYMDLLFKLGFNQVEIINSKYGFVSFLAQTLRRLPS